MKKSIGKIITHLWIYALAFLVMLPLINNLISCFKSNAEINRVTIIPQNPSFENFIKVFQSSQVFISFGNTIVITVSTLVLSVIICSFAAYPIARRKEKIYGYFYLFFLSSMMIPAAANLVPVYRIMSSLHLVDHKAGLVLIYIAGTIPMGILLYSGFIKGIPKELEEAAVIDGCNYFQCFTKSVLPLLKPVTVSFMVTSILSVWNDFLMPLLLLKSPGAKTITLFVYSFTNEHESDWGAIYALLTVALIPPVLLFLFGQKYFYKGITIGAVKG